MAKNGNGNGNGANGGPNLRHLWELQRVLLGEAGRDDPDDEEMEEFHLDCQGRKRHFRVRRYITPVGGCLEAVELRDGQPTGWRLPIRFDEESEIPPYFELRTRLAQRLATRDLVRDPETGQLEVLHNQIRAQINDANNGPELLVDGDVVTWKELGRVLEPYVGWGLRIQITNTGEE